MQSFKRIDGWALGGSLFNLMVAMFVLLDIINPEKAFPFTLYWSNTVIRVGGLFNLLLCILVTFGFIGFAIRRELKTGTFHLLLVGVVLIGLFMWFELWWGSTFYYGEVRDKQGLGFPWRSWIGFCYVIWRVKISARFDTPLCKFLVMIVVTILLWMLWEAVIEPWHLWQS